MRRFPRTGATLALLALLAGPVGCATAPAGGDSILAAGSIESDAKLGAEQHPLVLAQYGGAYDDPELAAYVTRLGNRLKNVSELADLDFTFTVLDSDIVNAFALPGGYIYVSRGLIALTENEAELAGVIAHEIGHVTARHGAQAQTRGTIGQLGVFGATVLGAVLGGEAGAKLAQSGSSLLATGVIQSYSREQEFQADELGVRYLARAGYDPRAMSSFLEALETSAKLQARIEGREAGSSGGLDHLFASHPRTPDRVRRAAAEAEDGMTGGGRLEREALLAVIDGLVFGDSPAQGFILGQRFVHPELRFAFEVPGGFELANTPQRVVASENGRVILFDMGKHDPSEPLARYAAKGWIDMDKLTGVEELRLAGGLEAIVGYAPVQANGGRAEGGFALVRGDDDKVYRFALITDDLGSGDRRDLRRTIDSFRLLSASEAASYKPLRIEIVDIRPGETVADFARRMDVDELPEAWFETLNGLDRGRELVPGDKAKIVVRK